ncbi:phenylalanine--tRNA ligase beta subunit [Echinicola pacifica]|uniref:Phenylalanine--tRNA ligase beta subunit n=1 Tax=Echinicola pacifica TaxID=346377 RepID=A0A918QBQ8_9BACT|nr:phenylalanine--tRNA ligase subunit beta [Echinicola pacifica]GGZ39893.1 phenylalanine--tRNA ligase beta subunit [Echinicola pacifica]
MKVSINRLKKYIHFDEDTTTIADLLTQSGLEVEGVERYESIQGGLAGMVIGEVLTCEPHPNADRLRCTTVDIGTEVVPIVCGAPNVAKGQKVVVATVGATLYPEDGESFVIKKAKIRGEVSEGMICAGDELGLGHSHDGIMVLDTSLENGTSAKAYFDIEEGDVLEIGLTPNRADAASHLGVARDLKALLKRELHMPDISSFKVDNTSRPVKVEVESAQDCPRYAGLTISGLKIQESPAWLQNYLRALGLEPINNVVDITNFILHDLGQPLHAFDLDKVEGDTILVKKLPSETAFITLDEKERKLTGEELMICDPKGGLCIAGVFGGEDSGVSDQTTSIFLESAYFSPDVIRRGSLVHGLKTDASFRFERGTDPNMPLFALKAAALLIKEIAGGEISSEPIDLYPHPAADFEVAVKYANVDRLIGKHIPAETIKEILENLEIGLKNETEVGFTAIVKPYRVDVTREADIIEEILRIYGFENVLLSDTYQAGFLAEHPSKDGNKLQYRVSELLTGMGYHEIMTNSLTKPVYSAKAAHLKEEDNVEIYNKLSEDLGVMRQTLLFTGLEVLAHNINRRQKDLKFYEFGNTYFKEESGYREESHLSLFLTGAKSSESWLEPNKEVSFPDLYTIVERLFEKLNLQTPAVEIIHEAPYDYALRLMIGAKEVGTIGLLSAAVTQLAEVKQAVFYAELSWDIMTKKAKGLKQYEEISKFPEVRRDLSLVIDKEVSFDAVKKVASKAGGKLLNHIGVFDVYQGDKIDAGKKAYALSFYLQDNTKTLNDKMIDQTMNRLMQSFEKEIGALIRK